MQKSLLFLSTALCLISLSFFSSCSAPEPKPDPQDESFDPDLCSDQMGYERGMNDGTMGRQMNSKFALRCREDLRKATHDGYNRGYDQGFKIFQERSKANQQTSPQTSPQSYPGQTPPTVQQGGTSINVNIGRGSQTVNGGATGGGVNERAFYCYENVFMTTFEDFGPTLLEAKKKVIDACTRRYHRMHCDQVQCQKNE